jgi:hypothetical protein
MSSMDRVRPRGVFHNESWIVQFEQHHRQDPLNESSFATHVTVARSNQVPTPLAPVGSGRLENLFRFAEPSRRDLRSLLEVRRAITGPGDKAIGSYEHRAQAKLIPGVTSDIHDPAAPALRQRLKRWTRFKVQE